MTLKLSIVPQKAIVVRRERTIVAASWFGPWVRRPYVYPFLAPGGLEVTRLGHPLDPVSHSHHRSIWVGHASAGGVDFWSDSRRSGRIVQDEIGARVDEGKTVSAELECSWRGPDGTRILEERRILAFHDLPGGELALDLDMTLAAAAGAVELGVSNFGLLGIRVARTMRVHDGLGGLILNSEDAENEIGCFGQHAVWCDMSGPVPVARPPQASAAGGGPEKGEKPARAAPETPPARPPGDSGTIPAAIAGIACFDHPANPGGGVRWHVRDDGWMGPSLTRSAAIAVTREAPLRVRYRIVAHAGRPWHARIGERYRRWRREQSKAR